jgi:hypothetical protein
MDLQHPSFFIFGPERSGTTLLTFLLSGQPDVFVLNDSFVFDRYVEWALLGDRTSSFSKAERTMRLMMALAPSILPSFKGKTTSLRQVYYGARARFALRFGPDDLVSASDAVAFHRVLEARYLGGLDRGVPKFHNDYVEGIPQPGDDVTIRDLLSSTVDSISRLFDDSHQTVLGEKTPIHTPYAEWISRLYPSSKRILMVRDPVANVASIHRRIGNFKRAVRAYDLFAECLLSLSSQQDVLVVTHEDLTSSTSSTLAQILSFLDPRLTLDETCPVNAYTKRDYTGGAVDKSRVTMAQDSLSTSQVDLVAARYRRIRQRFYD